MTRREHGNDVGTAFASRTTCLAGVLVCALALLAACRDTDRDDRFGLSKPVDAPLSFSGPCANAPAVEGTIKLYATAAAWVFFGEDREVEAMSATIRTPAFPAIRRTDTTNNPTVWLWQGFFGQNCDLLFNGPIYNLRGTQSWVNTHGFYPFEQSPRPRLGRVDETSPGENVAGAIERFVFPEGTVAAEEGASSGWDMKFPGRPGSLLIGDYDSRNSFLTKPTSMAIVLEVNNMSDLAMRPDYCDYFPDTNQINVSDVSITAGAGAISLEWETYVFPKAAIECGWSVDAGPGSTTVAFNREQG